MPMGWRATAALAAAALLLPGTRCGPDTLQLFSVTDLLSRAVCNDGSDAGYYYTPAADASQQHTWLLMLEGGEWCYDAQSCAQRYADTPYLMTLKGAKSTATLGGIFETDPVKTPFAGAHKVYVPYCSSDAWVGDTEVDNLLFRGQAIVAAVLKSLVQTKGLGASPGDRLLFGGCSAGARGATFNLDYVPSLLAEAGASDVAVSGLLDSPLWIDVAPLATSPLSLQCQAQAAVGYLNATARLGEACVARYPSPTEHWRCLFGEYRVPTLRTPYALNADQYDTFQLEYGLGGSNPPSAPGQYAYADAFGEATLAVVSSLPAPGQAGSGVFSGACFHHCVTFSAAFWGLQSEGVSFSDAVRWWWNGDCPPQDCPNGMPTQVIEHCNEGFQRCKSKCTLKHSTKGGKHKPRAKKTYTWKPGDATPPSPALPLACQAGPPVPVLPNARR